MSQRLTEQIFMSHNSYKTMKTIILTLSITREYYLYQQVNNTGDFYIDIILL